MINIYPEASRFRTDLDWLTSRASFSFGEHYDPDNTEFGPLRVFNDDIIGAGRGFGAHPHREMEIVSVVLRGQLKHEDSTGRKAITGFGGVQRMSAGTGIIHSEVNPADEECHILQIWMTPSESGLTPSYETSSFDPEAMKGRLLPIVARGGGEGISDIHQDLTMYLSRLDAGKSLEFRQDAGRRVYLFIIEGSLSVNGSALQIGDAARITEEPELTLETAGEQAFFMLIDLP
ncbi:pirin family protein [Paenibacillus tarimensis]|uniref:pirin family protein n=1 Tax=Paenibacillus tarimensis TaxID=416012 RepID=UPI001F276BB2|nr:pirin family protein [Paenibacillus tarimensis]MCF2943613.1 pirin family protein [Paenibacillus tarimensis]